MAAARANRLASAMIASSCVAIPGSCPSCMQAVHAPHVVRIDVLLVRKRDRRRLLVRALAQPHAALRLDRALDVGGRAVQIALQHDADVLRIRRIEPLVEQAQRALGVRARLHVEPHERPVVPRAGQDVVHDRDAELLGDVEPHRRELDRHVGVEPALVDAVEHAGGTPVPRRAPRPRCARSRRAGRATP